ncbi:MAG: hypothetical protein IT371_21910 [Deltaproteobacteria bacterium]|nr:hypothetical protein [Deltaproteobacteria bacterium]
MHARRWLVGIVAGLLLATPGRASAVDVGLELTPGAGIPLGNFPYGVPLGYDDAPGEAFLKVPDSSYNILLNLKPTVSFNLGLTLMINNFTLRSAIAVQKWSSASSTRFSVTKVAGQKTPELVQNLYVGTWDTGAIDISSDSPTFITTRFALGYRWYLLDTRLRPYVPVGFGMAMLIMEGEANFGLNFYTGAGLEFRVTKHLDLGVAALYEWVGIFLPENFQASAAQGSIAKAASSGNSVFEAFIQSSHTLQLALTSTYRF